MSKRIRAVVAAGIVAALGMIVVPSANAQVAFPKRAKQVKFWLARAMDPCTPGSLSVLGAGVPGTGCFQTNTVTDGTTTMRYGKIVIGKNGRIALSGAGFTFGDVFRVRLQLRITKQGLTTKNPTGSNKNVTFADQAVDCPPSPSAFTVRPNGSIATHTDLATCLAPYSGLAGGATAAQPNNIEIVDASLVSVLTGKIIARPGILR